MLCAVRCCWNECFFSLFCSSPGWDENELGARVCILMYYFSLAIRMHIKAQNQLNSHNTHDVLFISFFSKKEILMEKEILSPRNNNKAQTHTHHAQLYTECIIKIFCCCCGGFGGEQSTKSTCVCRVVFVERARMHARTPFTVRFLWITRWGNACDKIALF